LGLVWRSHNDTDRCRTISFYINGSINVFDAIDVGKGKPFKDFGCGFYTSQSKDHADALALRNRAIEQKRQSKKGQAIYAYRYTYQFDLDILPQLNVKRFDGVSAEWMRLVVKNRTEEKTFHSFDVVIGPTANDNTRDAIGLFFAGAYGDINSAAAIEMLIQRIEPENLPPQMFFGTQRAAKHLIFQERTVIQ
jgi:hypothetical protein